MKYLYVFLVLATCVMVYMGVRWLNKKVDETSELGNMLKGNFIKDGKSIKTQAEQFYSACSKKFGETYQVVYNYNLKDTFKLQEDLIVDFVFLQNEKIKLVISLKQDEKIELECKTHRKKLIMFEENTPCDDLVLLLIEKKLEGKK